VEWASARAYNGQTEVLGSLNRGSPSRDGRAVIAQIKLVAFYYYFSSLVFKRRDRLETMNSKISAGTVTVAADLVPGSVLAPRRFARTLRSAPLCSAPPHFFLRPALQITNRSFRYASPHLWNQIPSSFRQPHCVHSLPGSPHPIRISPHHSQHLRSHHLSLPLDLSLQT